jgi:hypothetical protein
MLERRFWRLDCLEATIATKPVPSTSGRRPAWNLGGAKAN